MKGKLIIEIVNEGFMRQFFTGHQNSAAKEHAKRELIEKIDELVDKYAADTNMNQDAADEYKERLYTKAEENGWRGYVKLHTPGKYTRFYGVAYHAGTTGLQNMGRAAVAAQSR
jgi:hypothetical protein